MCSAFMIVVSLSNCLPCRIRKVTYRRRISPLCGMLWAMVSVLPVLLFSLSQLADLGFQAKMVYIASLNDQVVPLYSGLFTNVNHPLILRAVYIDGDAYQWVVFESLLNP